MTMVLWGWRNGERWVWWTLLLSGIAGLSPALIVHMAIDYTDFVHLAPAYLAFVMTTASLLLSYRWLVKEAR